MNTTMHVNQSSRYHFTFLVTIPFVDFESFPVACTHVRRLGLCPDRINSGRVGDPTYVLCGRVGDPTYVLYGRAMKPPTGLACLLVFFCAVRYAVALAIAFCHDPDFVPLQRSLTDVFPIV